MRTVRLRFLADVMAIGDSRGGQRELPCRSEFIPTILVGLKPDLQQKSRGRYLGFSFRSSTTTLVVHQEASQLLAAARMTELAQRLRFDLTDTLARDVELLADFFERVVRVHVDAETHAQHFRFARREAGEDAVRRLAERFHRRGID